MTKDTSDPLRFLAQVSRLYRGRFVEPLWRKYGDHGNNNWDAIGIFLEGYAYAREGAGNDAKHAASDTVQRLKESGTKSAGPDAAQQAWEIFSGLLKDSAPTYTDNPMCPKGTEYQRKYRGGWREAKTSRLSALELMTTLASEGEPANIIAYARQGLEHGSVSEVYHALCGDGGISGIRGEIASLFLRDVASYYEISPSKERHLLQPVDVWVKHVATGLMKAEGSDEEVAAWIVKQAAKGGSVPEAVNQGMWYFGSQVAGSQYRASHALDDLGYARDLVDQHVEALSLEVIAWAQVRVTL
jgi:hypothetical protein